MSASKRPISSPELEFLWRMMPPAERTSKLQQPAKEHRCAPQPERHTTHEVFHFSHAFFVDSSFHSFLLILILE